MSELRTILIGYDGFERDEPLPEIAATLAEAHGARVRVVHVAEPVPLGAWSSTTTSASELQQAMLDERTGRLDALLAPLRARGIEAEAAVRIGIPHAELIRDAMESSAGLLVVVDEPSYREAGRSFGVTTMKLLRLSPCPVLAKRVRERTSHGRIMAAVDVGPAGSHQNSPNRPILRIAGRLALGDADLIVLHAWTLWGEHTLRWSADVSEVEMAELRAETERMQRAYVDELLRECEADLARPDGAPPRVVLERGDPDEVIPKAVAEHGVDLLVMGTVSRGGIPGLVIGNTAERILNTLACSVLTVKPDDFVSPVTREA